MFCNPTFISKFSTYERVADTLAPGKHVHHANQIVHLKSLNKENMQFLPNMSVNSDAAAEPVATDFWHMVQVSEVSYHFGLCIASHRLFHEKHIFDCNIRH